ncbi:MAG: carboxymuconolactone decarboxylase family protein [Methyloligellaceae bacterium]
MHQLAELTPAFAALYRKASLEDLRKRAVLDDERRHAAVIAALVALRQAPATLEAAFGDLLEDGCPPDLAEDVVAQMAAYAGYASAGIAMEALAKARKARGLPSECERQDAANLDDDARYERGIADYARLNEKALATIRAAFGEIAPDLPDLTFRAFGDVYTRSKQPLQVRQIATVAGLAALGGVAPQLRFHICAALNVGVTREEIVEAIAWVQFFAGMPAAYNALVELKQALAAGPTAAPGYR